MKILFVINQLHSGGAEQQLIALCEGLVARGHYAHVISIYDELELRGRLDRIQVPITVVHKYGKMDVTILWRLYRLIKTLRPELIHAYLPAASLFSGLTKWLGVSAPVVQSERSISSWKSAWRIRLDNLARRKVASIVCNAKAIKRHLVENEGVLPEKLALIYNGLVPDRRHTPEAEAIESAREQIGAPHGSFVVVSVANFVIEKQHHVMLEACALARKQVTNLYLVLVGKGELEPEVRAMIQRLALESCTRIIGDCVNPLPFLCAADAALMTSSIEGCSNALLEAMAMGLPIVATNAGGNAELVTHGRGGVICPIGSVPSIAEGLAQLSKNPIQSRAMGCFNQDRVNHEFTDEIMVQRTLELYRMVLPRHAPRSLEPALSFGDDWKASYRKEA